MGQITPASVQFRVESLEMRVLLALFGPELRFGELGYANFPGYLVLAALPDDKILVAGNCATSADFDPAMEARAYRLNSDGSLDTSYGTDGVASAFFEANDAGFTGSRLYFADFFSLLAFNFDGARDSAFSGDGTINAEQLAALIGQPVDDPTINWIELAPDGGLLLKLELRTFGSDSIQPGAGDNVIDIGDGADFVGDADSDAQAHHTITGGDGNKHINLLHRGRTMLTLGTGDSQIHLSALSGDDQVTITGGNNHVTLSGGNDALEIGGEGISDVFVAAHSSAQVTTGDGDDYITVFGSASVSSNGGEDTITLDFAATVGPVTVLAGPGDDRFLMDTVRENAIAATVHGGTGRDFIQGSAGAQAFYGDEGNDTILGGEGNNRIYGGEGNDSIKTGAGADAIYGDSGSDTIKAGGGNDRVSGGAGRDHIFGQQGDDHLSGTNHSDAIDGGPGNDRIFGQTGSDKLFGGYGEDTLEAGPGADYVDPGRDNDLLLARDSEADSLFGGAGTDRAEFDELLDLADGIEVLL